jgi:pimeloyl-ACP methyl ester carboxylesterase
MSRKPPTNCSRGFSGERRTTGRTALLQLSHKGAMWLYRKLGRVHGRIRFFKHYCVARKRSADLKSIETFVHERLIHQYSNAPKPAPNIGVTFQLLAQDGRYRGVYFDAPIVVMVTLDATPAFGMAFEVRGKDLRIRQLHGVRGISFRGRYNALRPWPRFFVHACQDLAMACGYKRVMVVRSHRSYSWPRPSNRNDGPSTPEDVSENAELRLRLIKRLDETAKSIDGFEMGTQWWIWRNPVAEKYRTSLIDRSRTRVLAGITGFAATLVAAIYAINGPTLRFHIWKVVAGKAHGGKWVDISDVSIYYETYGAGMPVLVLHGGLDSIEGMAHQIKALANSHFVVAADSRGHGRSTDSNAPLSYSLMSSDMLRLLDYLQVDQVDVVGWSDGGIIGLDLAIHYPKRIRRLVAISANYDANGLLESRTSETDMPRPPLRYKLFARDPAHWPVLYRKVVTMWKTQPHYTLKDLENIKAPALIMAGELDIVKHEHINQLSKAIPGSEEIIIAGATHRLPFEKPDIVSSHILKFLDEESS